MKEVLEEEQESQMINAVGKTSCIVLEKWFGRRL